MMGNGACPGPHQGSLSEQLAMSVGPAWLGQGRWPLSSEPVVGPLPNLAFLDSYCHDTSVHVYFFQLPI